MSSALVAVWSWIADNLGTVATILVATAGVSIQARMLAITREEADRRQRETRWAAWTDWETAGVGKLIIECHGPAPAHGVEVLVDGVPPNEHGTAHRRAPPSTQLGTGARLSYDVIVDLASDPPRQVQIAWRDPFGKAHELTTDL